MICKHGMKSFTNTHIAVDETASHDQVAHKIVCLYIPLLF